VLSFVFAVKRFRWVWREALRLIRGPLELFFLAWTRSRLFIPIRRYSGALLYSWERESPWTLSLTSWRVGESIEGFLENYPGVRRDQVFAFLEEASRAAAGKDRVKRVLFDENLPRLLRRKLTEFEIRTVQEEGWGALKNGDLLPDFNSEFSNALLKKFISRSRKSGLEKLRMVGAAPFARTLLAWFPRGTRLCNLTGVSSAQIRPSSRA